jgi:pyruvate/2-oxoglutarate dehydrogenase complex dihydrolipoamide acyltransferase (E2) component
LAARRAAQSHGVADERFAAGAWVTAGDVIAICGARAATPPPPAPAASVGRRIAEGPAYSLEMQSKRKRIEIRNLAIGNSHSSTSTIGAAFALSGVRLIKPPPIFREPIADLVIFEGARLLKKFARLNACWMDERQIALYETVNFGVSFDSGDNLKVLAIRNADQCSLIDVQTQYLQLLDLYESGDRIEEALLTDATVTLSDLSGVPISFMHPLLNGRQSLILGVTHASAERFDVFASFDHRVSEGLAVARFLEELKLRVLSHFRADSIVRADGLVRDLSCSACMKPMTEELRLGGRGLLNVTLGDGSEGLLCRNCFVGY